MRLLLGVRGRRVERGWGAGAAGGVTGRLARPISKAEGLRFYPQVVSSPRRQGRFRTEPHSPETSGGRGFPKPWNARTTEGCARLRLHKASSSLHRRDQWGSVGRDTHLPPRRKHLSHVRSR